MKIVKEGLKNVSYHCTMCGCEFEESVEKLSLHRSSILSDFGTLCCPNCGKKCFPKVTFGESKYIM